MSEPVTSEQHAELVRLVNGLQESLEELEKFVWARLGDGQSRLRPLCADLRERLRAKEAS